MSLMETIKRFSNTETYMTESAESNLAIQDTIEEYSHLAVTPTRVAFPASQVPVAEFADPSLPCKYGVSSDIFSIFMERNGLTDIAEAMSTIAMSNGLKSSDIMLVLDSDSVVRKAIDEAKVDPNTVTRKEKETNVGKVAKLIQHSRETGVFVAKEPNVENPPVFQVQWNDNPNIVNIEKDTCDLGLFSDERPFTFK